MYAGGNSQRDNYRHAQFLTLRAHVAKRAILAVAAAILTTAYLCAAREGSTAVSCNLAWGIHKLYTYFDTIFNVTDN